MAAQHPSTDSRFFDVEGNHRPGFSAHRLLEGDHWQPELLANQSIDTQLP